MIYGCGCAMAYEHKIENISQDHAIRYNYTCFLILIHSYLLLFKLTGYYEIDQEGCEGRGCCYVPTAVSH